MPRFAYISDSTSYSSSPAAADVRCPTWIGSAARTLLQRRQERNSFTCRKWFTSHSLQTAEVSFGNVPTTAADQQRDASSSSLSRSLCNFTIDQQNFVFNLSRRIFLGRNPSIVLGSLIFIYSLGHRKRSALFCYTLYLQLVLNVYFEYKKSSSHAQDELL